MTPRFEYRVWGEDLVAERRALDAAGSPGEIRDSRETYLVGPATAVNAKIRNGSLDVKELVRVESGCEQWRPRFCRSFPLPAPVLAAQLEDLLGPEPLAGALYTAAELVAEVSHRPGRAAVEVEKRRHLYTVGGCVAELAEVDVGGTPLYTAAVESEDLEQLVQVVADLGLDRRPNRSYVAALQRSLRWLDG